VSLVTSDEGDRTTILVVFPGPSLYAPPTMTGQIPTTADSLCLPYTLFDSIPHMHRAGHRYAGGSTMVGGHLTLYVEIRSGGLDEFVITGTWV